MADANFSMKCTLAVANQIRKSLEADRERLLALSKQTDAPDRVPAKDRHDAGTEAMEIDRILSVHF